MLKVLIATLFTFLCVGTVLSQTAPPVDGIYWDPSKGGRGYAVETQNNNMFVAIYDYDVNSSPTFYTIQANWDSSRRRVSNAELLQVVSGPWIGGPFSPVGQIVSKGPVTLEFPTFTTARFTFNGQTSNLQRFLFGYGSQANSLMRGVWHTTYGATLTFGDLIVITGDCPTAIVSCSTLTEPFVGNLSGLSSRVIVGSRLSNGNIVMLVDSSTSYYSLYMFDLRVNQWIGWEATFLKTQTAFPTSGLFMIGDRMVGPAFAPKSLAKAASSSPEELETMDTLKAKAAAMPSDSPHDAKSSSMDMKGMQSILPVLRDTLEQMR